MATIFIQALKVETLIGICDWEREVPQQLLFDIHMDADTSAAAESDNIDDALDYAAVAEQTTHFVQASTRLLLEPLLHDLAQHLLKNFTAIDAITLTVRKPQAIAAADCAGVTLQVAR
ncbi:MAG: dihydroneopterin aldolase [Pseudomonadales bacterium]|nr:dihydroneopterin aldolase [Pseudomonadales bacterium]